MTSLLCVWPSPSQSLPETLKLVQGFLSLEPTFLEEITCTLSQVWMQLYVLVQWALCYTRKHFCPNNKPPDLRLPEVLLQVEKSIWNKFHSYLFEVFFSAWHLQRPPQMLNVLLWSPHVITEAYVPAHTCTHIHRPHTQINNTMNECRGIELNM